MTVYARGRAKANASGWKSTPRYGVTQLLSHLIPCDVTEARLMHALVPNCFTEWEPYWSTFWLVITAAETYMQCDAIHSENL